jgi:hypothetical protein
MPLVTSDKNPGDALRKINVEIHYRECCETQMQGQIVFLRSGIRKSYDPAAA